MTWLHLTASTFFGGPERQMLGLATHLPQHIRSHFATFAEGGRCEAFLDEVKKAGFETTTLQADTPRLRAAVSELVVLIRTTNAKILFTHTYKPNLLGRLAARNAGVPHVVVSRGWTGENWKVRAYEKLDRFNLRFADAVVAVSQGQAEKVKRAGVPDSRVHVIRNAARLKALGKRNETIRAGLLGRFGDTQVSQLVIAAGRLSPEKGFDILIDAAAQVVKHQPHAGFLIFGEGVEREALAAQIRKRSLERHVILAGFTGELDHLIAQADVVVLPSRTEGLPNVALEASAAGVPVVATVVGGTPEVVLDGETGYLVPKEDSAAMARRLCELLVHDELRSKMGMAGKERMTNEFSFERQAERYEQLVDSLMGQNVRAAA